MVECIYCSMEQQTAPEQADVSGLLHGEGFNVECYYSFDIQFFNN